MELLQSVLLFIGGLGMFLYGMHVMAEGLQKSAGKKTKQMMGYLTNHRLMGVLIGALVTAIIQSSSATTVMVVGFVNAGILNLVQAVGVIMGANIGTTMTAWLVSMSEWGALLKPDTFAPLLLGIGAFLIIFTKKDRKHNAGMVLVGFGILFTGLSSMSGAVSPYADAPIFSQAFTVIGSNPILGILVGLIVTGIIQSSSASMGILQTLAMNGMVNWGSAVFIALGQNIGTCVTAMISAAGASANAKRAAVIHLLFNTLGAVVFGIIAVAGFAVFPQLALSNVNSVHLALFHTFFNVLNTCLLYPFAGLLVKVSQRLVKDDEEEDKILVHLDARISEAPSFALESVKKEIDRMGKLAYENIALSVEMVQDKNGEVRERIHKNEKKVNEFEKKLVEYLITFDMTTLTLEQQRQVKNLLYTISDLERISDHCESIAVMCHDLFQNDGEFSISAYEDMKEIGEGSAQTLFYALDARKNTLELAAQQALDAEVVVDSLEVSLREKHMRRLAEKKCRLESGVVFLDVIESYERISDHASNIAKYVLHEMEAM